MLDKLELLWFKVLRVRDMLSSQVFHLRFRLSRFIFDWEYTVPKEYEDISPEMDKFLNRVIDLSVHKERNVIKMRDEFYIEGIPELRISFGWYITDAMKTNTKIEIKAILIRREATFKRELIRRLVDELTRKY